jgi:hypothetical protein
MVQDLGGLTLKLPIKNLRHIYEMVSEALTGNWDGLSEDFLVQRKEGPGPWQMVLTPRPEKPHHSSYASIIVIGTQFVETIQMTKANGDSDSFSFIKPSLSSAPLAAGELATFAEAGG